MLRAKRHLIVGLGLALLLIATLPAAAQEGIPGSAPAPSEESWTLPYAPVPFLRPEASALGCTTGNCVFLPLVRNDPPWIDISDKLTSVAAYHQQYFVSEALKQQWRSSWTGSYSACAPGDVSAELKAAILRRVNYFRGMAGVPARISFNSEYTRKAQAAALMISVNRQTSANPPVNWRCWSLDGWEGSASSNLSLGGFGVDAIQGQMRDRNVENADVRHRRWILYPQTSQMGTGNVPEGDGNLYGAALWVRDANEGGPRPETRHAYVAWPPPGYVPYPVVFARWSFTYPNAYFNQAAVTMSANGVNVSVSVTPPGNDSWESTLVWIPFGMTDGQIWPKPAADTIYHVTISNVKVGLDMRTFSYDVIVFDPDA